MDVDEILDKFRTIAIVGVSKDPLKDSHRVASYLKSKGYKIIPINPSTEEIFGERCYKNLLSMPANIQEAVEVVDIFLRPEKVLQTVMDAIELKKVLDASRLYGCS